MLSEVVAISNNNHLYEILYNYISHILKTTKMNVYTDKTYTRILLIPLSSTRFIMQRNVSSGDVNDEAIKWIGLL